MKCVTRIFESPRGVEATHGPSRRQRKVLRGEGSRRDHRSERGSSLILALVYIVSVSLIVGALADWAMNDLNNTSHFQTASSLDNAISGATEVAIQSMRYYPQYPATFTTANCWTPPGGTNNASDVPINGGLVGVWCSTVENLKSPNTRVVTFTACPVTAAQVASPAAASTIMGTCLSGLIPGPSLKAVVTFDDYPSGGGGLLTQTCSGGPGVCGFAATTNQLTWS
jgi:hypothetical protein